MDVFARIMTGLAAETPDNKTISLLSSKLRFDCRAMDAIYLKAHRTASSLRLKKGGGTSDWADQEQKPQTRAPPRKAAK